MKRHQSLTPFSKHHHQALILAQVLQKNSPKYENIPTDVFGKRQYFLSLHLDLLKYHFKAEEKILFPFIKKHSNKFDELIDEIISEHSKMEFLFEQIREEINLEDSEDQLGKMLIAHVRKEERILFEKIQNLLDENLLEELSKITSTIDSENNSCDFND